MRIPLLVITHLAVFLLAFMWRNWLAGINEAEWKRRMDILLSAATGRNNLHIKGMVDSPDAKPEARYTQGWTWEADSEGRVIIGTLEPFVTRSKIQ